MKIGDYLIYAGQHEHANLLSILSIVELREIRSDVCYRTKELFSGTIQDYRDLSRWRQATDQEIASCIAMRMGK